uniref:Uncharacterized protein n=1 Tax=Spongospora subterranea TaxID=70186 RepID=A0A0H5R966_9EUKA|eukprot:CRZ10252.1 hypothetical protein [Spongospora subterranea]
MDLSSIVLGVSGLIQLHAILSAVQYQHWVKLSHSNSTSLPWDIIAESGLALAVCISCSVYRFGRFKQINAVQIQAAKTLDEINTRPEFMHFNCRDRKIRK